MKIRFFHVLLFTLLCSITISLSHCKKDKGDPCAGYPSKTNNYYVSDDNKSKIPYTGTDTLVFISDVGDTATLYGQGKQTYMQVLSTYSSNNPDCGNISYWNFEHIVLTFIGSNSAINKLVYGLSYPFVFQNNNPPSPITESNALGFEISSGIGVLISCGSFTSYANNNINYIDSVAINGLTYKGVNLCDSSKGLYNYQYGILRFKDASHKTWTRKF